MKSIKFLLPLAALALSGIAAASSPGTNSVVVRYGDLDLNSQQGVVRLHKRIRNAAESVCGSSTSRIFGLYGAYEKCVHEASSNAVNAVGNTRLTHYYATKG